MLFLISTQILPLRLLLGTVVKNILGGHHALMPNRVKVSGHS